MRLLPLIRRALVSLSSTVVSLESDAIDASSRCGNTFSGAVSTPCGWKAKPSAGGALNFLQRPVLSLRNLASTQPKARRNSSGRWVEFSLRIWLPRLDMAPTSTWALRSAAWIAG